MARSIILKALLSHDRRLDYCLFLLAATTAAPFMVRASWDRDRSDLELRIRSPPLPPPPFTARMDLVVALLLLVREATTVVEAAVSVAEAVSSFSGMSLKTGFT